MNTIEQILAHTKRDLLPEIMAKTQELKQLHSLFCGFLSTELVKHCQLAKIEDDILHVVVDSATWGARLRYSIPDILKNLKLQPEFKGIKKIKYHINIEAEAPVRKLHKNKLSQVSEKLWRQVVSELKNKVNA